MNPHPRELWNRLEPRTRQVAAALGDGLLRIFGDDLAAVWLYGASVFGPHAVDLDFHILLRHPPDAASSNGLRALHKSIEEAFGVDQGDLDAWYILLEDARRSEEPANLGPWNFGLRDAHWALHRAHWLAGACAVIYGLGPARVVIPPTWEDLRATLEREADEAGRQLAGGTAYWTLQLCRVWASLATRNVVRSKIDAGRWARRRLSDASRPIIEAAIRYYRRRADPGDERLILQQFPAFYRSVRAEIDGALDLPLA